MALRTEILGSATPSSARRTTASSAARGAPRRRRCRGCCTWSSCAARSRMLASGRSTPRAPQELPGVVAVVTGELWRSTTWPGCRRCPETPKPCSPRTRCASRARRSRPSLPRPVHREGRARADRRRLRAAAVRWRTPQQALEQSAPLIRDEKEGQTTNHIYQWEAGDKEATDGGRRGRQGRRARHVLPALPSRSARVLRLRRRREPGDRQGDDLHDLAGPARAPHAVRDRRRPARAEIRIISPDIGGGFGNKVPIYPGYVVATAASLLIGRPVKWIEDRTGNLISTGFARDYHMHGELAVKGDRKTGLRVKLLSDNGAFFADAQPSKFKAGPVPHRHRLLRHPRGSRQSRGAYTNKAPGGVAPVLVPRHRGLVPDRAPGPDAAHELDLDPAELRRKNFIKPEQFPYTSATGFVYDSGDYRKALRARAREARLRGPPAGAGGGAKEGKLIGIGLAAFTEVVGAGPASSTTSPGCACSTRPSSACTRPARPCSSSVSRPRVRGTRRLRADRRPRARYPYEDIEVQEGDTDNTPYGLGTYAAARRRPRGRRPR